MARSAIGKRLGNMTPPDMVGTIQIGYGPRHPQNPVIGPRGQSQMFRRGFQKVPSRLIRRRDSLENFPIRFRVASWTVGDPGGGQPLDLTIARRRYPRRHATASFLGRGQG